MKKIFILLVVLGILLAAVSVVHAQDPYRFRIWPGGPYYHTISPGETVELGTGWAACTYGLTRMYTNVFNIELSVNGDLVYQTTDHDPYWTSVEPYTGSSWDVTGCIAANGKNASIVRWFYTLPNTFEQGETYEVMIHYWLDYEITDGYDDNSDGIPNTYEGHGYSQHIFIVE